MSSRRNTNLLWTVLRSMQHLLSCSEMNENIKKVFSNTISDCIQKFSSKPDEAFTKSLNASIKDPNPTDQRLSNLVRISVDNKKGRQAHAAEGIPVGSILCVDDCTAAHLNPDNTQKILGYCLHCLKSVSVVYPCMGCCQVVFCSPECQDIACGEYSCSHLQDILICFCF